MKKKRNLIITVVIGIGVLVIGTVTVAGARGDNNGIETSYENGIVLVEPNEVSLEKLEKKTSSLQKVELAEYESINDEVEDEVGFQIGQAIENHSLSAYDVNNLDKRIDITIQQKLNELRETLKPQTQTITVVESGEKGVAGEKGAQGPQGLTGSKGDTGKDGKDGEQGVAGATGMAGQDGRTSFVVYSQYASGKDADGNSSFFTVPNASTKYIGVALTVSAIAPTEASAYSWSQYLERTITYDNSSGKPTIIIH